MTISPRPYQAYADLQKIQAATAEWIASAGFLGYMNVSDIALRLFMGMRRFDPREIVRLWADDAQPTRFLSMLDRWMPHNGDTLNVGNVSHASHAG